MSSTKFHVGDIVENLYTSARASVMSYISYPPELELVMENNQVISVHADDWFVVCSVHDCLAMSRFNGGSRLRGETVHS